MFRNSRASALIMLCCTVAGATLVGCSESSEADSDDPTTKAAAAQEPAAEGMLTGTEKIKVGGQSVNVSCSGDPVDGRPVVVLMAGAGDDLTKMAGIQKSLSTMDRVCSYDRLGQGASDRPERKQSLEDSGKVLTAVLDRVAGDGPVVLAGHSLGGLIAARYAPDHQDTVKGLVLMDATSPTQSADIAEGIPDTATGQAATLREQTLAALQGKSPEKLVVPDGKVRSAGSIPVEVIQHGKPYLEQIPEYGPGLEQSWAEGQRKWLDVSSRSSLSTAANSGHHIYLDEPDVAVGAIQRVTSRAAGLALTTA